MEFGIQNAPTKNRPLLQWVDDMKRLCQPESVYWVDGSAEEGARLTDEALQSGVLNKLKLPGCTLHRSDPSDVARVEKLTFICTDNEIDAGPTNNWMAPDEAYRKLGAIFDGAMRGRTMYVIPYVMGPPGSPFSKVGVEITDSIYVVLNMRIMTRAGQVALDQLADSEDFVKGLHSTADLDPQRRFICHFPQDNTIWSVGSGYGGNALLGKKCHALRLGSAAGRREGWMAEHMLIVGIENPQGEVTYIAAAFPSACGKTNLAMLVPPASMPGWKVWTVGDDIAWMHVGSDGRLWAINPEAGFFGVAPGTSVKSNPNAMRTISRDTIFTNVLQTSDSGVWWEGMSEPPSTGIDWRGLPWTPASGEKGAHPNARFTVSAAQCPSIAPNWNDPQGVPISAILFGGRRARTSPLVYQTFDWVHGVYTGATMASETTAAAAGAVGVVRRDPMAMLPFCGYHMGDDFSHWLSMGQKLTKPPKIFHVNWFRTSAEGKYLWPGFGENLRVVKWIVDRSNDAADAVETPIGFTPAPSGLPLDGLDIAADTLQALLSVDRDTWRAEVEDQAALFTQIGERMPQALVEQRAALRRRLDAEEV